VYYVYVCCDREGRGVDKWRRRFHVDILYFPNLQVAPVMWENYVQYAERLEGQLGSRNICRKQRSCESSLLLPSKRSLGKEVIQMTGQLHLSNY
jgi:hypothetical protein